MSTDYTDLHRFFEEYFTQSRKTVALLDANGEVVERNEYDAFGMPAFYDGAGGGIDEKMSKINGFRSRWRWR